MSDGIVKKWRQIGVRNQYFFEDDQKQCPCNLLCIIHGTNPGIWREKLKLEKGKQKGYYYVDCQRSWNFGVVSCYLSFIFNDPYATQHA